MSQHDYAIANGDGATVRGDINDAFAAAVSNNAGTSPPSPTFANMWWPDTTNMLLKQRNQANTQWVVRGTLAETVVESRSSDTILGTSDYGKTIIATSTFTQTLSGAAALGGGWYVDYRNDGTGLITIDPNLTEQIDGATTITLTAGESCRIVCDGASFKTIGRRAVAVAFRAYATVAQTMPSATYTKVNYPSEEFDVGGYYDASMSRWTPPAGKHRISAFVIFDATAGSLNEGLHLAIYKNGVAADSLFTLRNSASIGKCVQITTLVESNGADYFEVFARKIAAGAGNVDPSGFSMSFSGETI